MLFKVGRNLFVFGFAALLLISCEDGGNGAATPSNTISTVEELQEFVSGINFLVTLENGETLMFTPEAGTTNYVSEGGGFNFVGDSGDFFDVSSDGGSATLTIGDNITLEYEHTICTDVREIRLTFPQAGINPIFDDIMLYYAFVEDENQSLGSAFFGDFTDNDFHVLTIATGFDFNNRRFFDAEISTNDGVINLPEDTYSFHRNGLSASGTAYFSDFSIELGKYDLELTCE